MSTGEINDELDVSVDQSGQPIGFRWRGGYYLVSEKPIRWFSRKEWWLEASRVPKGIGHGVFEVEVWRILAAETAAKQKLQFEFVHELEPSSNSWRLSQIID
jgi:hypothetical protein